MIKKYRYCPYCRAELESPQPERHCPGCGATFYENAAAAAGILLLNDRHEVLLGRRTHDPNKGSFDIPGGFLQPNESAEAAARREVQEESGLTDIEILDLLGTFPDRYGDETYTINMFYVGLLKSGEPRSADDIEDLRWYPIDSLPQEALDTGLSNIREVLAELRGWHKRHMLS